MATFRHGDPKVLPADVVVIWCHMISQKLHQRFLWSEQWKDVIKVYMYIHYLIPSMYLDFTQRYPEVIDFPVVNAGKYTLHGRVFIVCIWTLVTWNVKMFRYALKLLWVEPPEMFIDGSLQGCVCVCLNILHPNLGCISKWVMFDPLIPKDLLHN